MLRDLIDTMEDSALREAANNMQDKAVLSDTPLSKNLENPDYLKIILDGETPLEVHFSEIVTRLVHKDLSRPTAHSGKVPRQIKKLIKMPELPVLVAVVALFSG